MALNDIRMAVEPYVNKLAAFKTADEIRDFLVAEGIKAQRIAARKCAIAEYVASASGVPVAVSTKAVWTVWGAACGAQLKISSHTAAMAEFISNFDIGKYPELVADPSEAMA